MASARPIRSRAALERQAIQALLNVHSKRTYYTSTFVRTDRLTEVPNT